MGSRTITIFANYPPQAYAVPCAPAQVLRFPTSGSRALEEGAAEQAARARRLARRLEIPEPVARDGHVTNRVEGGDDAVDDREASAGEHGRVEARIRAVDLGDGEDARARHRLAFDRPHRLADGDVLGLLQGAAARAADGKVVAGREDERLAAGQRDVEECGAGAGLRGREERDRVGRQGAVGGGGDDLLARLERICSGRESKAGRRRHELW